MEVAMKQSRVTIFVLTIFVAAVGLLFLAAVLFDLPPLQVKSPGSYIISAVSLFFVLFGLAYGYLLATGRLERQGRTITEVRQEAIEKMRDQNLLAKTAKDDPNPLIREGAKERLQELRT
jgi:hypothetical protein